MYAALSEAEQALDDEEIPIGAVVVYENKIIGRGYNQVEKLNDPTAHAEMIAVTAATNHLSSKYLDKCAIYVTVEPCVMCTGAILNARLGSLYFGTFEPKFGACGSLYNIPEENKYPSNLNVYSGIYADESKNLLQSFFKKKRKLTK